MQLAKAYEVLSDENRRVLYDKKLHEGASLPSKSTESSVAARARAYMMHRAEELKRERQARERTAEKARKEREERERAAEKARKEQEARERVAEKVWKEQEAREREAEKAKKEQDARERAANLAKGVVARAEQEWILGIEATIKLMLTMRSSVQTLEAEIWQTEQRDLDILDGELRAECRAKNSTAIWERSPEGLEKEHARKRKDRLMQLMGKKLELEQARKHLNKTEADYEVQLGQESGERQKAARRVEVELRREVDGLVRHKARYKEKSEEEVEMQERLAKGREALRQEFEEEEERQRQEEERQKQRMYEERMEQWREKMRVEAEEKERREREEAKRTTEVQRKERALQECLQKELNKRKEDNDSQPVNIKTGNSTAHSHKLSVAGALIPGRATRANWEKYGRCLGITQRGAQCTKTLNCNYHRCEDPDCDVDWIHAAHDGSVETVPAPLA